MPAHRAAALIDASEALTVDSLRASYGRIAQAKQLRKSAPPKVKGAGGNTATLGIVLAVRSDLTLEAIAEEMRRLNEQTPGHERPDIVVVASTGLVQYSAQFPGENVSGDFILPGETLSYAPPMYILMVMKPTGTFTLNRMLSFLVGHLATFSPGSKLPRFPDLVEGVPNNAVTLTGYQYNLAGDLVPVPRQFYNDRYLAPRPVTIEDGRGNVLATVQFLPWQDGGVILLRGKFPMEMLLVLLGPVAGGAGFVKRPGAQISYAIPIMPADFGRMLERLHRQSNLLVRPDETEWVVKKLSDEGSQSPFTARILAGILRLRDAALSEGAERDGFDKAYDSVITPLRDARARMRQIAELWESHARRVQSGEIARLQGRAIHVDENVDKDLGQETDAFLGAATRALKTGMQSVAAELGVNIGFLFQKQGPFDAGLAALTAADPALATYVRETRQWSERLVGRRNAIEHENWRLPDVIYARAGDGVTAAEPLVDGQPVTAFAAQMLDRLACLVEEITAHLLQKRLMMGVTITEVPVASRPQDMPERFRVTLAIGGLPAWVIAFHASSFEET